MYKQEVLTMKKFDLTGLLIHIVSAELVGALSALISGSFSEVYSSIARPPLSPPSAVFPIVWAILYALMGASAYIIFSQDDDIPERNTAIGLYVIQLAVNFAWSIIFFRFRAFFAAAVTAVVLAMLVTAMVLSFRKVSKTAALMNLPYLLWSFFAAYLAFGVWLMN